MQNIASDATLANLTISAAPLFPLFSPNQLAYNASVNNSILSTTVTATANDPGARISINGATTSSGVPSAPIALAVGPTLINVVVVAQNGFLRTYTVIVNRAACL